jgi:hypothetical protein
MHVEGVDDFSLVEAGRKCRLELILMKPARIKMIRVVTVM